MKPSPFCVLDEIDASLDESNLERFTQLLREFAADTQFIVITHRPATMEAADSVIRCDYESGSYQSIGVSSAR